MELVVSLRIILAGSRPREKVVDPFLRVNGFSTHLRLIQVHTLNPEVDLRVEVRREIIFSVAARVDVRMSMVSILSVVL